MAHVSPTALTLHKGCRKQYWFERAAGVKPPRSAKSTAAALLGTEIHKAVDQRLQGLPHVAGTEQVQAAAEALYTTTGAALNPKHPASSEWSFSFPIPSPRGTFHMLGQIDVLQVVGDTALIVDHKTKGYLNPKYLLSPADLSRDTAAMVYCVAALCYYPKVQRFNLRWQYIQVSGKPTQQVVAVTVDRAWVLRRWAALADEVAALHNTRKHLHVVPNKDQCKAYGGCPHLSYCDEITPSEEGIDMVKKYIVNGKITTITEPRGDLPEPLPAPAVPRDLVEELTGASPLPPEYAPSVTQPDPAGPSAPRVAPAPTTAPTGRPIGTLYVNCLPTQGHSVLVPNAYDVFKAQRGADDFPYGEYRLVEYGRGPSMLRHLVRLQLEAHQYPELYIDRRTAFGEDIAELLGEYATRVVRAF